MVEEQNDYARISADLEKVMTRLTNDTRTCICTLRSLTITRDSFALSILGLKQLQEMVDELAERQEQDELAEIARHVVNPPSDYPEEESE